MGKEDEGAFMNHRWKKWPWIIIAITVLACATIVVVTWLLIAPLPGSLGFASKDKSGDAWEQIWCRQADWVAYRQPLQELAGPDTFDVLILRKNDGLIRKKLLDECAFMIIRGSWNPEDFFFMQKSLEENAQAHSLYDLFFRINLLKTYDYYIEGDAGKAANHYRRLMECARVFSEKSEFTISLRAATGNIMVGCLEMADVLKADEKCASWLQGELVPGIRETIHSDDSLWQKSFLRQYALISHHLDAFSASSDMLKGQGFAGKLVRKDIELRYRMRFHDYFGLKAPALLRIHLEYIVFLGRIFQTGEMSDTMLLLQEPPLEAQASICKRYENLCANLETSLLQYK